MTVSLELLAPAGNADIGIAAINHGADAVYIGAPKFSARANAGVDAAEIARLIRYAHLYYARVYVALNTILRDDEMADARRMIHEIYESGADGLIIQDRGILELDLPPIPLIASTQMHNDTADKVCFLEDVGFHRVILARELSVVEIAAIRKHTNIELEVFVHGALCVSYSGQCYMSQAVAGRSGNRGVCAQPCRSRYTLTDGDGRSILSDKFLLSLKDLNLMEYLPDLVGAGVTSFKIEGRYKEIDYVKNVTAAYSQALDLFIDRNPGYRRSSSGRSEIDFVPDPAKTFNRGFTRYFVLGGKEKVASLDTQKSIGQPLGTITGMGKGFFRAECADLQNGDGICFFTGERELAGFRVERVEGDRIYPNTMQDLARGVFLYRNYDIRLSRMLSRNSGRRRIAVSLRLVHDGDRVRLTAEDEDGNQVEHVWDMPYEEPRNAEKMRQQIATQLASSGNTPFRVVETSVSERVGFFPISRVTAARRLLLEQLEKIRLEKHPKILAPFKPNSVPYPEKRLDFHANILNQLARRFYERHGAEVAEPALETLPDSSGADLLGKEVMKTRYCLRYQLDACPQCESSGGTLAEPLRLSDGHHVYRLRFDCAQCRMSVILERRKQRDA